MKMLKSDISGNRLDDKNHVLYYFITDNLFYCNECKNTINPGKIVLSCEECDYDICENCDRNIHNPYMIGEQGQSLKFSSKIYRKGTFNSNTFPRHPYIEVPVQTFPTNPFPTNPFPKVPVQTFIEKNEDSKRKINISINIDD